MSEPIKVGDIAIVVRHPHCNGSALGMIVIVEGLHSGVSRCLKCGYTVSEPMAVIRNNWDVPTAWLKKIDPPALDETLDEREESTA
jgi:hypothetical protein